MSNLTCCACGAPAKYELVARTQTMANYLGALWGKRETYVVCKSCLIEYKPKPESQ